MLPINLSFTSQSGNPKKKVKRKQQDTAPGGRKKKLIAKESDQLRKKKDWKGLGGNKRKDEGIILVKDTRYDVKKWHKFCLVLHEYSIARESINLAQTITISFPTDKEALYVDYYVISSCIEKKQHILSGLCICRTWTWYFQWEPADKKEEKH